MKLLISFFLGIILADCFLPIVTYSQPSSSIEWQKCIGGSNSELCFDLQSTSDGGYILTGLTYSSDGDVKCQSHALWSGWVVRLDPLGAPLWSICIDGDGVSAINSVVQTTDGGFILAGTTRSLYSGSSKNHGEKDVLVVKLNKDGTINWQKVFGGSANDIATSIIENRGEEGGYTFVGNTSSTDGDVSGRHLTTNSRDSSDLWVVKITFTGEIVWQRCLGGDKEESANSITQTPDFGYAIVGFTASHNGDVIEHHFDSTGTYDAWIIKLNSSGSILWQHCLGGSGQDEAKSVSTTSEGNLIIAGETNSTDNGMSNFHEGSFPHADIFASLLSSTGVILWQKCFGGTDEEQVNTIIPTKDRGYLFIGSTMSNDGDVFGVHTLNGIIGDFDIWIGKLNRTGVLEWQKCLGGSYRDKGTSIVETSDSKILLAGHVQAVNGSDIVDAHSDGIETVHAPTDIWVAKLGISAGVNEGSTFDYTGLIRDKFLKIYPNPSSSSVRLEMLPWFTAKGVEIYNLLGTKLSCETTVNENGVNINVHALPNGTYIARISYTTEKANGTFTLPLIVYH